MGSLLLGLVPLASCQANIVTPFPPGLEPFEDNIVREVNGPYVEMLRTATTNTDYIRIYARGYVLVSPATLWQAVKSPDPNVAVCSTTEQIITPNDEPAYEYSFSVHYIVSDIVTLEWDDAWRFGIVLGTPADPQLGMMKHQKTQGSDYIHLSEGTIEVLATADPNISELSFVEHLDALGATVGDVLKNVQHNYDSLVAAAHQRPLPACP